MQASRHAPSDTSLAHKLHAIKRMTRESCVGVFNRDLCNSQLRRFYETIRSGIFGTVPIDQSTHVMWSPTFQLYLVDWSFPSAVFFVTTFSKICGNCGLLIPPLCLRSVITPISSFVGICHPSPQRSRSTSIGNDIHARCCGTIIQSRLDVLM